jgi:membrane-associated phospholipid phosphatase
VKQERFKQINFDTTVRLQDNIPARFDEPLEDLSFFVSPVLSLVWVSVLTLLSLINLKEKKLYLGALLIPVFFALMITGEIVGKARVESPAPPFFLLKNPTTIFPRYHVQEDYSYPSGHAARLLFFAGIVSYLLWRTKKRTFFVICTTVALAIVLVMSLGKVHLGHHWLSDIVGGWIIALAFLCFSYAGLGFAINFRKISHV